MLTEMIENKTKEEKYLIPNTLKERVENFKSLPRYCPVMVNISVDVDVDVDVGSATMAKNTSDLILMMFVLMLMAMNFSFLCC